MSRHSEKFLALATFIAGMSYGAYHLETHLHNVTRDNTPSPIAITEPALAETIPSTRLTTETGE